MANSYQDTIVIELLEKANLITKWHISVAPDIYGGEYQSHSA